MAFKCDIPAHLTSRRTIMWPASRIRVSPRASAGWHRHGLPYFLIMLVDGMLRINEGTTVTDDITNGSEHPNAFLEIEVKRPDSLIMPRASVS
jgi:beta-alanine degradation protein BauB